MKKSEFIKLWVDIVRDGRKRNFPDMRPSEQVMSALDDMKDGAAQWRKNRARWTRLERNEVERILTGSGQ